MGLFDDVPFEPKSGSGEAAAGGGVPAAPARPGRRPSSGIFDDVPMEAASGAGAGSVDGGAGSGGAPVAEQPSRLSRAGTIAADVANSAGAGIIRGAAGTVDLPQNVLGFVDHWIGEGVKAGGRALGVTPNSDLGVDTRPRGLVSPLADLPKPGESALQGLEAAIGKLYEPRTMAGEFARTAAEFVPGSGKKLGQVIALGVIPGLASEGAGQATKGSAMETPARIGTGVIAGLGGAAFRAPSNVARTVAQRTEGATAQQVDQAEALFQEATARGLPLTRANALDAVSGGVTSLSDLQRVLEGNGRLKGFFAPTAAGVEREGRGALDTVGAASPSPAVLGGEVQDAARAGVAQTPQGMALTEAVAAGGPRVTPEQAGQVIQPELRRVYEGREGMRAALGEQDYAAARAAPETVGIERTIPVERPGEPIITQPAYSRPQFTDAAPRPVEPFTAPTAEASAGPGKSLARFIAENGGLRLDGDAAATDLHRFMVPGVGKVARPDGKSLDSFWRERLIEEGYFRPDADGGMARDIGPELLRKLQNEQRGVPSYPMDAQGRPRGRSEAGRSQDEYDAARSTAESRLDQDLARTGVDPKGVHQDIKDRAVGALMRGEATDPLDAYERTVGGMKGPLEPYVKSTTIREEIPDVRFGQANPQPVVDHIDDVLRSAKGPVAKALASARETLFTRATEGRPRELDLSVAGLHGSRDAINDLIAKAEPTAQRALIEVRNRLDRSLSTVPEYEYARSGFEAASRNLDPFATGTAPGRVVNQDQASKRLTMPPERVPAAIDEGPSAGRDFKEVASPEARTAYEGHLRTSLMDAATDATTGEVSSGRIRELLRSNEDGLRQFPAVREHLERVAFAREVREAVDRSPLGRIAKNPVVQDAVEALFPSGGKGTSAQEVGEAVRRMAANNPRAAQDLVRMHMEQVFDQATERLQTGPNQAGGAKFAKALVGHSKEAAAMEAAVKALPGGEKTWTGIRRLLDIFDAQGARQAIGSGTSFNDVLMADMKAGKPISEVGAAIATGGLKLPGRIMAKIEGWRMGEGLDEMARLFTDPKMASTFRRLATEPQGAGLLRLASMVVERGIRGYGTTQRANAPAGAEREPLKFTVRPGP